MPNEPILRKELQLNFCYPKIGFDACVCEKISRSTFGTEYKVQPNQQKAKNFKNLFL